MRLRRFLISEPIAATRVPVSPAMGTLRSELRARAGHAQRYRRSVGGGVTAARGPLESQVEVRNLAPEHPPMEDEDDQADPTRERSGTGRRGGHAHAVDHSQGAAPALRSADAP